MRKEHKYKRSREYESDNIDSFKKNGVIVSEFEDLPRKSKKHKSHRSRSIDDGPLERDDVKESSNRGSRKVIHVHGSSSEDERNHNSMYYKSDDLESGSRDCSRGRIKKSKRRHRSRSGSVSDSDSDSRKRNYSSRKHRNLSDSGSESRSNEHRSKHKCSKNKHFRKEGRRNRDESNERSHCQEQVKITIETANVKSEPSENEKRNTKWKPRDGRDGRHCKWDSPERKNSNSREQQQGQDKDTHEWGGSKSKGKTNKATGEVQKPNFGLSGKLAEDTNIYNGVVIKYSEPPEARMPKKRWRLYQFKGDQDLPTLYIHRQSAYLLGRDRKVADIPIDHPSCSKQHAALQYRLVPYTRADGSKGKQIRLYIIDLESANGTFINNNKIEAKKYVELFEKDVIKFGFSSREYVLLHEHSKDDELKSEEEET
ncbi:hypothetical protein RUM44_012490 [Polyplax serrata]|uniref:FHA domain-containing protein n=1 Tax=Polyplax serrata TaxID=468196 RepID=A0ABR1BGC1_POLSC